MRRGPAPGWFGWSASAARRSPAAPPGAAGRGPWPARSRRAGAAPGRRPRPAHSTARAEANRRRRGSSQSDDAKPAVSPAWPKQDAAIQRRAHPAQAHRSSSPPRPQPYDAAEARRNASPSGVPSGLQRRLRESGPGRRRASPGRRRRRSTSKCQRRAPAASQTSWPKDEAFLGGARAGRGWTGSFPGACSTRSGEGVADSCCRHRGRAPSRAVRSRGSILPARVARRRRREVAQEAQELSLVVPGIGVRDVPGARLLGTRGNPERWVARSTQRIGASAASRSVSPGGSASRPVGEGERAERPRRPGAGR